MEIDIFSGDNGNIVAEDRLLGDFGEVLEMVKKMPKLDTKIKHYSQYSDMGYYTGCTIMQAINSMATINNKDFTKEEIAEVYAKAKELGRNPGFSWVRGSGLNAIRKRWNAKYPGNQMMFFSAEIFSDEFNIVMEKLGIASISINVDSAYWKDARDNLYLNNKSYKTGIGHATTMMELDEYVCVDSIPAGTNLNEPMIYTFGYKEKIEDMIKNGNLRKDCHIIIMNNRLKQEIDNIERTRLIGIKSRLEDMIAANSWIWENTNNDTEKKERNRQNIYNRAKLKIINAML